MQRTPPLSTLRGLASFLSKCTSSMVRRDEFDNVNDRIRHTKEAWIRRIAYHVKAFR